METDQVRFEDLTDEHLRGAIGQGRAIIVFQPGSSLWNRVPATGPSVFDAVQVSPSQRLKRPFEICISSSDPTAFDRRFQEVTQRVDDLKRSANRRPSRGK